MSALDLSARTARRELGALVEAADDHDLIAAFARAVWSVLVEPGDRVAGALVLALGPAAALETVVAQSPGGLTVAGSEAAERAGLTGHDLAQGCGRWMPRLDGAESALAIARRAGVPAAASPASKRDKAGAGQDTCPDDVVGPEGGW